MDRKCVGQCKTEWGAQVFVCSILGKESSPFHFPSNAAFWPQEFILLKLSSALELLLSMNALLQAIPSSHPHKQG